MAQQASEDVTFRHKTIRAETRTDPSDGQHYTWTVFSQWYADQGWSTQDIKQKWDGMDTHSFGRTRTKKKTVLPNNHPLIKKRKKDTAEGSRWEA